MIFCDHYSGQGFIEIKSYDDPDYGREDSSDGIEYGALQMKINNASKNYHYYGY